MNHTRAARSRHYRGQVPARFLTRKQVAEELNISMAQCYALIRRGELRAAKKWRTWRLPHRAPGRMDLEAYIERAYAEAERWIDKHPFTDDGHMI